jgi:tripartite-type tricarboxylate transporter receptor subunit TctC
LQTHRIRGGIVALAIVLTLLCAAPLAHAESTAEFYKGKTVRVIVGFPPGGGFDLYARTVAEFLPRHLPGGPRVIVENMPGASTARAAAFVYGVAPQDGTVMGIFHQGLLANQALGVQAGDFDVTKFNWIGRMGTQLNVGIVWRSTGVETIADATKKEIVFGATAPTATSAMVPRAINHAAGTKIKIVTGYQGSTDMYLAMERGETHGMATGVWFDLPRERPDWIKEKKIAPLFQISTRRISELPDVPVIADLARNDEDRAILDLLATTEDMGRAFATGTRVPAERVGFLRAAFAKMMADPDFLKECARRNFEIAGMAGEELQAFVGKVGKFPPELGAKAKKVLMP